MIYIGDCDSAFVVCNAGESPMGDAWAAGVREKEPEGNDENFDRQNELNGR